MASPRPRGERLAAALLLALVLLVPTAQAWSVELRAPASAPEGLPFAVEVCARAEGRGQVRVLAANASLDVREDRYLAPFDGTACRAVVVEPEGGAVELEARVRPAEGGSARASATARVALERAAGELRLLDAWAPPFEGVVLENVGDAPARLALRTLEGARLPEATLAPGERAFLGPRAPPDAPRHLPMEVRVRNGSMELAVGARVESALVVPKLAAGRATSGAYGRTDLPASTFALREVEAYATPGPTPLPRLVDEAREEVLVASHTLTSPEVAAALLRALDRGARVRVLLEGAPPGGIPPDERGLVVTLQHRGAQVLLMEGEGARYRTMHAKLIVVDRAVVAIGTENLNEGGSRGFGLLVRDAALAGALARVMDADAAAWHDVAAAAFPDPPMEVAPAIARPPPPASVLPARAATLVLSPDDPGAIADAIRGARASVDVAMLRARPDVPPILALVDAARAGARVRLLLDGRHDDGVNRETATMLTALAAREGLALEAKLDGPERTLHAKAFVVDGATSYVGSMNWVPPAIHDNREAGLLVESEALAAWLALAFEEDWREDAPPRAEVGAPGWPGMVVVACAALSLRARRLRPRRA